MGRRAQVLPEGQNYGDWHIIMVNPKQEPPSEADDIDDPLPQFELHEYLYGQFSENDTKWMTGYEIGQKHKKWHWHCTIYGLPISTETLRARLNKFFSLPKKGLSIKPIKNPDTVLAYTAKGGLVETRGLEPELVADAIRTSYQKDEVKKDFKKVLSEIEEEYLRDKGPFQLEDFVEKYLQAYLDYGKPIYLSHIKARLITIRLRKSPERLKGYVRGILDDLGLGHVGVRDMDQRVSYPNL